MYYIMNEKKQIIAVDSTLLELLQVNSNELFMQKIALKEIVFRHEIENRTDIITTHIELCYESEVSHLFSVLGTLTLVTLTKRIFEEEKIDIFSLQEGSEDTVQTITTAPIIDSIVEEPIFVVPEAKVQEIAKVKIKKVEDKELIIEEETAVIEEKNVQKEAVKNTQQDAIVIDTEMLSKEINVSVEDYTTFLNEYIDTALSLEKDLESESEDIRSSALNTLTYLANMLKLPVVNDIIKKFNTVEKQEKKEVINDFYHALVRITIAPVTQENIVVPTPKKELKVETIIEQKELVPSVEKKEEILVDKDSSISGDKIPKIELENIKEIPFILDIVKIAETLQLPVMLVEGFMEDFISQIHIEKDDLFLAYYAGNLEVIHTMASKFKVIATNLQLEVIVQKLTGIIASNTMVESHEAIVNYWSSFLSFEQQVDTAIHKVA